MAEAVTVTPERTLRPRKGKSNANESADSTTKLMVPEHQKNA
jgi:hypothetical protein